MLCSSGWRPCRARAIPARWLAVGAERGQQKWLRLRLVEHLSAHGGAKELVCVCVCVCDQFVCDKDVCV